MSRGRPVRGAARRAGALLALLALAACGAPPPADGPELLLRVLPGAGTADDPVLPGRAFPLTVERRWSRELEPAPFEERALAPLVLRLDHVERREQGGAVTELRRYAAYAFALGDVRVPAAVMTARPRAGGPERRATSARLRLTVAPTLDPRAPGAPEPPGGLPPGPAPGLLPLTGAALPLALLVALRLRARRRRLGAGRSPPGPAPAPPPEADAAEEALAALERLGAGGPPGPEGPGPAAPAQALAGAAEVVRGYVARRYGLPALRRTSPELLAALSAGPGPGGAGEPALPLVTAVLARADAVKFAAAPATAVEASASLDEARAFVERTRPRKASP